MKKNVTVLIILTVLAISSFYLYLKVRHLEQRITQIEERSEFGVVPAQ